MKERRFWLGQIEIEGGELSLATIRGTGCQKQKGSNMVDQGQWREVVRQDMNWQCFSNYINLMGKKTKSSDCKGRWCQRHLFSIRPYVSGGPHTREQIIRLCPKYDCIKKKFSSILPELNPDHRHYTPFFILEEDRRLYSEYDDRNRASFQRNQEEEEYEISEIMVPKVTSTRRYCKVCKSDYEDYLEHVESRIHGEAIRQNVYSSYMMELQQKLRPTIQTEAPNKIQKDLCPPHLEPHTEMEIDTIIPDRESLTQVKDSLMEIHFRDNILL